MGRVSVRYTRGWAGWDCGVTKRAFDLLLASAMLIAGAVPMAAIALLVRLKLGKPVLFRQCRPGLHGRPFELIKFRTMIDRRDATGAPLPDADRLTPLGAWLRATSIDELPELWNIVRGDMSLVGPRPLLMQYLPLYSPAQARRHLVRPGITGWAQINGRNAISWEDKLALDVWYVDHAGLLLDLRILARTFGKVVARSGINHRGDLPMPLFTGTPAAPSDERG